MIRSVSTMVKWEAAHRLHSAYSEECKKNIHGHSYKAEVTFGVNEHDLNKDDMVIDFKKFKEWIHKVVDTWDHALFLHEKDPLATVVSGKVHIWDRNPTAEVMAEKLLDDIKNRILCSLNEDKLISLTVSVWETADNKATVFTTFYSGTYRSPWETEDENK